MNVEITSRADKIPIVEIGSYCKNDNKIVYDICVLNYTYHYCY